MSAANVPLLLLLLLLLLLDSDCSVTAVVTVTATDATATTTAATVSDATGSNATANATTAAVPGCNLQLQKKPDLRPVNARTTAQPLLLLLLCCWFCYCCCILITTLHPCYKFYLSPATVTGCLLVLVLIKWPYCSAVRQAVFIFEPLCDNFFNMVLVPSNL